MTKNDQIEEMARVYDEARLKARETLGSMNEGEAMWYSKAFYSADYRKVERGEWIEQVKVRKDGKPLLHHYQCSLCGVYLAIETNFCPNCGADMRGD